MLRCTKCGGLAHPGLAHFHGNPNAPLCKSCTDEVMKRKARGLDHQVYRIRRAREFARQLFSGEIKDAA